MRTPGMRGQSPKQLGKPVPETNAEQATKPISSPFTSNRGYQGVFSSFQTLSKQTSVKYLWDGSCGLDKGRISIPITNNAIELKQGLNNLLGRSEVKGQVSFTDFPDLYFSSCVTPGRAVQVEFNFSDFTKSFGINLCPFGLAPEIIRLVIHHTVEHSGSVLHPIFFPLEVSQMNPMDYPTIWARDVQYSRLELARDFTINNPRFKLEQMRYFRPSRAKAITATINDYSLNTLSHPAGSQSARLTIYNKSLQAKLREPGRYPDGTFRFEAKLPRKLLKRNYIPTVHQGSEDNLHYSIKEFWQRSNYWKPLLYEGNIHQELLEEFGSKDGALLIGYADSCAKGLAEYYTQEQHIRYGQLLKQFGIKRYVPLERQGTPYAELSFTKGSLSY